MADMQQTLRLILEAKDEASQVLQKAGKEMAELGKIAGSVQEQLAREGVSVGNLDAIRVATRQRTEIVKQNVEEQIKELRRVEQETVSGAQRATQEILQQSRSSRDQTIADARQARDEKLAALKDETSLSKAERATRAQDIRDEANRTMAQARADHNERVRMRREEQQSLIAEARSRTTGQLAPLRQAVPYVQAGAEGLRAAHQAAQDLERQTVKEQEETEANAARVQQQMAKEGAAAKREALLADTEAMREAAREAKAISDSEKQDAKEAADAVKRAAAEKQEALRADTEAMREAAREAKALAEEEKQAAKEAADAVKQAAAEKREAIRADKEAMREAAREAKAISDAEKKDAKEAADAIKEAEKQKQQALKETAKSAETATGGFGKLTGILGEVAGPLAHLVSLSEQMLVWNTLYQVWGKVTDALSQLVGGIISTNVQLEQLSMTFAAVYQKTPQVAKGMIDALDVYAATVPGTREDVRQAALAFASAGDNVREILPAVSNLAAIMGVDMPRAAQAMIDAQEGRFEMLQLTLHVTKQELQAYGLEVDRTGHVTSGTFVPAIERFVAARFGEHLAMTADEARRTGESLAFAAGSVNEFYKSLQGGGAAHVDVVALQHLAQIQSGVDPNMTTNQRQGMLTQLSRDIVGAVHGHKDAVDDLNKSYGISVTELDKINKNWRGSIQLATESVAIAASRHYGGAALDAVQAQQSAVQLQMQTLGGAFSNVQDAFTHLQQVLGAGLFDVLKTQVIGLYNTLQSPELERFVTIVGQMLGNALDHVIDAVHRWYESMGGLPGILATIENDVRTFWGAIQGLGDGLHDVWTVVNMVIGPVLSLFGALDRAHDAADAVRDLARAAVDLYVLYRVVTILQAMKGLYDQLAAASIRAALAQRELAASQAAVAASAEAETVAEGSATAAVEASALRATATPATLAGAETAGSVGAMEAAMAGIGAVGTAALTAASPLLLMAGVLTPVIVALDAFKDSLDKAKDEQTRALVKPFIPTQVISAIPTPAQATSESHVHAALSYYRGGYGAASGAVPPTGEESSKDPFTQLMRMLPKDAQTLLANATTGTGAELIANERNFLEYLQSHTDVLKKLNAVLKAAHKPQITGQQISDTLDALDQQDSAIAGIVQQRNEALANATASVKARPQEFPGYVDQLWESTRELVQANLTTAAQAIHPGRPLDTKQLAAIAKKSMDQANAKIADIISSNWKTLPKDTQSALEASYPQLFSGVLSGLPGAPGRQTEQFSQDNWQKLLQDQENNMKLDIAAGQQSWPTIHRDYLQVLDTIKDGVDNMGMTSEQAWPLIEQAMQGALEDIPNLMGASAGQVEGYFSTLAKELKKRFNDPRIVAAALDMAWSAYYKEKIADLQQQLQDDLSSGTASLPTLLADADAHVKSMQDADTRARQTHAKLPFTQAQITAAQLQDTHAVYSQQAQTAELQLRYDEKIGASWNKIVADIDNYATMLHNSGENAQSVELTRKQKTEEAAQQFLQTQQGLLQYESEMGVPFSVLVGMIHTVADDMKKAGEPMYQIALDVGHAIKTATDTVLQGALDSGQSYDYMANIIHQGANELLQAGWSRIAVDNWVTQELRRAGQALKDAVESNSTLFDIRLQQGRNMMGAMQPLSTRDVQRYVDQQMAFDRKAQGPAGETPAERQVRLMADNNKYLQQGFGGLIDIQRKQFDFDTSPDGNAANAVREEQAIIKASQKMWAAEGYSPAMIRQQTQWLQASLDRQRTGGYTPPPEPRYQAYGGLGRQPGFGGVEVMFGGPSTNPFTQMIRALEEQNRTLQNQVAHLKALLAAAQGTQLNTQNTATFAQQTANYLKPLVTASNRQVNPVANLRGGGVIRPV